MKVVINPDKEVELEVRKAISDNSGYCPCVLIKNKDTKCPCKKFRENKECCCGLYITIE